MSLGVLFSSSITLVSILLKNFLLVDSARRASSPEAQTVMTDFNTEDIHSLPFKFVSLCFTLILDPFGSEFRVLLNGPSRGRLGEYAQYL